MNTKRIGDWGEEAAALFLTARRYVIKARKFRCPMGEIDLIAERDGVLVFVEVKTRKTLRYGYPAAAVNLRKQKKIILTATWYLQEHPPSERCCRFDVLEVYGTADGRCQIRQYENAFEA